MMKSNHFKPVVNQEDSAKKPTKKKPEGKEDNDERVFDYVKGRPHPAPKFQDSENISIIDPKRSNATNISSLNSMQVHVASDGSNNDPSD
mmetsp:Transcript_32992/g.50510  ORF Transcript_32992/g.50510 Transcript_32992/m.50510 type:complete len:90 (+) Transcript_32992:2108-2377(+)